MDMKYKDGSQLSEDEIVGLLIALLFAGQHTSSITSSWTTLFLLNNPECLQKVMEEQSAIIGKKNAAAVAAGEALPQKSSLSSSMPLDYEQVGEMEYLGNCTKEALRMFPPLIMLMRQAMSDIETTSNGKKYIIPKVC